MLDIVDLKSRVKNKEIEFYIQNGFIYCKNIQTEESVIVGEYQEIIITKDKLIMTQGAKVMFSILDEPTISPLHIKKPKKRVRKNTKKS